MGTRKILVLDIDGTLTNSDKIITFKTREVILRAQEQGHLVVLASGRPTAGMVAYAEHLRLADYGGYVLSFNGAKITNWRTKEVVYQSFMPAEHFPALLDFANLHDCGLVTYTDSTVISARRVDDYLAYEARLNGMPLVPVRNFLGYAQTKPNKCLMTAPPEQCAQLKDLLRDQLGHALSIYRSEPYFLEIMPQDVDKAASLDRLVQHLGRHQCDTVCCGDGFNDRSMIAYAGVGVAMENAQKIVKDVANFVTGSNNADGLVTAIEKFVL